jgi:hypothetical protein
MTMFKNCKRNTTKRIFLKVKNSKGKRCTIHWIDLSIHLNLDIFKAKNTEVNSAKSFYELIIKCSFGLNSDTKRKLLPFFISPQVLLHVDVSRGVVRKKTKMFGLVKCRERFEQRNFCLSSLIENRLSFPNAGVWKNKYIAIAITGKKQI